MEYRAYVSLNIAIIGEERVCEEFANAFAFGGHSVYLASLSGNNNTVIERDTTGNIHNCTIEDAAAHADFIIIGTKPSQAREVAYWLGDVRRKIIIDFTLNACDVTEPAIFTVKAISAITGAPNIVKAFSLIGYQQLFKPLFGGAMPEVLLAGDSLKATEISKIVLREAGILSCYDFGDSGSFKLLNELAKTCRCFIGANQPPAITIKSPTGSGHLEDNH